MYKVKTKYVLDRYKTKLREIKENAMRELVKKDVTFKISGCSDGGFHLYMYVDGERFGSEYVRVPLFKKNQVRLIQNAKACLKMQYVNGKVNYYNTNNTDFELLD